LAFASKRSPGLSRYGHLREDWERRAAIKNTIDK
jgi:hypothetical protein